MVLKHSHAIEDRHVPIGKSSVEIGIIQKPEAYISVAITLVAINLQRLEPQKRSPQWELSTD